MGNGSYKNWVKIQDEYDNVFSIVDLRHHSAAKPEEPRKRSLEVAATYLASGIDKDKSTIFIQSRTGSCRVLLALTYAYMGELSG